MIESNSSRLENTNDKFKSVRVFFPVIYIILLGVATLIFSFILVFFIGIGDPADFSEWSPERESSQIFFIITVGILHLLASITSSVLWYLRKQWSKYLLLVLAIIGTFVISFTSIGFIVPCSITLIIADIYLIRLLFFETPLSKNDRTG